MMIGSELNVLIMPTTKGSRGSLDGCCMNNTKHAMPDRIKRKQLLFQLKGVMLFLVFTVYQTSPTMMTSTHSFLPQNLATNSSAGATYASITTAANFMFAPNLKTKTIQASNEANFGWPFGRHEYSQGLSKVLHGYKDQIHEAILSDDHLVRHEHDHLLELELDELFHWLVSQLTMSGDQIGETTIKVDGHSTATLHRRKRETRPHEGASTLPDFELTNNKQMPVPDNLTTKLPITKSFNPNAHANATHMKMLALPSNHRNAEKNSDLIDLHNLSDDSGGSPRQRRISRKTKRQSVTASPAGLSDPIDETSSSDSDSDYRATNTVDDSNQTSGNANDNPIYDDAKRSEESSIENNIQHESAPEDGPEVIIERPKHKSKNNLANGIIGHKSLKLMAESPSPHIPRQDGPTLHESPEFPGASEDGSSNRHKEYDQQENVPRVGDSGVFDSAVYPTKKANPLDLKDTSAEKRKMIELLKLLEKAQSDSEDLPMKAIYPLPATNQQGTATRPPYVTAADSISQASSGSAQDINDFYQQGRVMNNNNYTRYQPMMFPPHMGSSSYLQPSPMIVQHPKRYRQPVPDLMNQIDESQLHENQKSKYNKRLLQGNKALLRPATLSHNKISSQLIPEKITKLGTSGSRSHAEFVSIPSHIGIQNAPRYTIYGQHDQVDGPTNAYAAAPLGPKGQLGGYNVLGVSRAPPSSKANVVSSQMSPTPASSYQYVTHGQPTLLTAPNNRRAAALFAAGANGPPALLSQLSGLPATAYIQPQNFLTTAGHSARTGLLAPSKRQMGSANRLGRLTLLNNQQNSQTNDEGHSMANPIASSSATSDPLWSETQNQEDEYQQAPQTIQITAVPNGVGAWNGANAWNGGLVNGWNGGWGGPWGGRQVLLVNRQPPQVGSEWRQWALPIAAILALPLILGALFVPVFLKSVMFLIQILQMLGLLMPPAQLAGHLASSAHNSSLG